MADGRTNDATDPGGDSGGTIDDPGGGPRRVVSDRGVDDILESLDDGPAASSETSSSADPPRPTSDTGSTDDETDDRTTGPDAATPAEDGRDRAAGGADEPADGVDAAAEELAAARAKANDGNDAPDSADDGTELTYEDGALSKRVAANDVTGADVRAAESGSDRESTPAIDDVDLSLDDLENAATGGSTTADSSDDEGSTGADDRTDRAGVFGFVRRLFSR